jgi:hypothetical protein
MTIADIHGKSPWTTSEDFLTANVFTAFRYLPASTGIVGLLRSIPGIAELLPAPGTGAAASFYFWPLGVTREPDVLIELEIDGKLYHVVVEAKYLSGASDYELSPEEVEQPENAIRWGNQLADQLRELVEGVYTVHHGRSRSTAKRLQSAANHRLLLYLTAHALRPQADLARSAALYPEEADRLFWGNWYQVHDYLENSRPHFQAFPFNRVVSDVLQLLALKGFSSFAGVRWPEALQSVHLLQGKFWQGRDEPLPTFQGIGHPPTIAIPQSGGCFWVNG